MIDLIDIAERGTLPDWAIRLGIRRTIAKRLRRLPTVESPERDYALRNFLDQLTQSPLAIATESANSQHYEVPAEFFRRVLGPRLKYSACLYSHPEYSLAEAENDMLRLTCQRAEIEGGMRLLELGCGWGSLTLWIAELYPTCEITAVSNSSSQKAFIEQRARELALENIRVVTADMRTFQTSDTFDRIISVEMFEHMRNYRLLFERMARWLERDGKAFVHVFCHRRMPYLFDTEGADNWMGRHFFTGGTMPSEQLFGHFDDDLNIQRQWRVNGLHYWRTCEAWLKNLDQHRDVVLSLLEDNCKPQEAVRRLQRWRIFFMACAELFRYRSGEEWFVAHYLFEKAGAQNPEYTPINRYKNHSLIPHS
jgi:cyclopropane-fatty-acyl-phospholipid synthase